MWSSSWSWSLLGLLALSVREAESIAVPFTTIATTLPTSSSSHAPSTITSAPKLPPWGTLPIPLNTCSYTTVLDSTYTETDYNKPWCSLYAGTVELHFWPTSDNKSYPATVYNSKLDYTFTSPSVYMVINTINASNECGPLGPAPTSAVFAFDLTEVSTLVPLTHITDKQIQATRQLYLSDLRVDCPTTRVDLSQIATQNTYTKDTIHRCFPKLAIPIQIKRYGAPYWNHCSNVDYRFGLFDPAYAMSPVGGGLISTTQPSDFTTTTSATTIAVTTDFPSSTSSPTSLQTSSQPADSPSASLGQSTSSAPLGQPTSSAPLGQSTSSAPTGAISPGADLGNDVPSTTAAPNNDFNSQSDSSQSDPTPTPPSVTTVSKQIVSLGPSGVVVINEGSSGVQVTSTYGVPVYNATEQGPSATQASVVLYQGQTLTLGGPAVTVSNVVVVVPANSTTTSAKPKSTGGYVTAAAPRTTMGGIVGVIVGVLVSMCLV